MSESDQYYSDLKEAEAKTPRDVAAVLEAVPAVSAALATLGYENDEVKHLLKGLLMSPEYTLFASGATERLN